MRVGSGSALESDDDHFPGDDVLPVRKVSAGEIGAPEFGINCGAMGTGTPAGPTWFSGAVEGAITPTPATAGLTAMSAESYRETDQVTPDRVRITEGVVREALGDRREFSLLGPCLLPPRLEQGIWSSRDRARGA